jgi:hypothetical protein
MFRVLFQMVVRILAYAGRRQRASAMRLRPAMELRAVNHSTILFYVVKDL